MKLEKWKEVREKDFSESQNCFQTHFRRKKREKSAIFESKIFWKFRDQTEHEKAHIWGQDDNGNFIFMEWLNCSLRWVFCSLGRHLYKTKECSSADIRPILQKNVQVYTFTLQRKHWRACPYLHPRLCPKYCPTLLFFSVGFRAKILPTSDFGSKR